MVREKGESLNLFKKIIDLSVPLKNMGTPVFPGYPMPIKAVYTTIKEDGYYSNMWSFNEHSGTHMDAPAHFVKRGKTVDEIQSSSFVALGTVLNFSDKEPRYLIKAEDILERLDKKGLKGKVGKDWILLFYTGYTNFAGKQNWFDHPELSEEACRLIVNMKICAIGIDAPSPDREPFHAHRILLPKGIVIYENLNNLDKLMDDRFLFVGAPLPLFGGSASPVRAIAIVM